MMVSSRLRLWALIISVSAIGVTGCGESILTAGAKVAAGQISQLSPNEIQILNQTVLDVLKAENPGFDAPPLTDTQAEALSNFFKVNNINTVEDIEQLGQTAQTNPEEIQGLEELALAFAGSGTEIDPNNVDPETLDDIFGALFGGTGVGSGTGGTSTGDGSGGDGTQTETS